MLQLGFSKVVGVGAYLPSQVVSSEELMLELGSPNYGIPTDFLDRKVGVRTRRFAAEKQEPSDLAIAAAGAAMMDAGIDRRDIDLIVFCGIDKDYCEPATASVVQAKLAPNAHCFDVSNACHGFLDGVSIANSMIGAGAIETALIVTGETPSRVTKEVIRRMKTVSSENGLRKWIGALTVGDSGGAMIVTAKAHHEGVGFEKLHFRSEGEHAHLCYYRGTDNGLDGQMLMRPISNQIVRMHSEMIEATYAHLGWNGTSIDWLVAHQVGEKPQLQLSHMANINQDRVTSTLRDFGNLTSSTIPVNLALNQSRFVPGDKVMILGTGSGISISQTGLVWGKKAGFSG